MSGKTIHPQSREKAQKHEATRPSARGLAEPVQTSEIETVQRMAVAHGWFIPSHLPALQRLVGNRISTHLIQAKSTTDSANDPYVQRDKRVADQVVSSTTIENTLSTPGRPLEQGLRQGAGQKAILQRQPDPKGPHMQPEEARLRVRIVDTLEATKRTAFDALVNAIKRGDRTYLEGLGLSSKQADHLLNNTPEFKMTFGTAAELAVEQAVRADPFLSQYVKRGPVGRAPSGVGKPDWIIETPSTSIRVDLMTPKQVEEKLEMWRRQWKRGKPKWYIEKGLNVTYDRPPGLGVSKPPVTSAGGKTPASTGGIPAKTTPKVGPASVQPPTPSGGGGKVPASTGGTPTDTRQTRLNPPVVLGGGKAPIGPRDKTITPPNIPRNSIRGRLPFSNTSPAKEMIGGLINALAAIIVPIIIQEFLGSYFEEKIAEDAKRLLNEAINNFYTQFQIGILIQTNREEIKKAQTEGREVTLHIVVDVHWQDTEIGTVMTNASVASLELVFEDGSPAKPYSRPNPGGVIGDYVRFAAGNTFDYRTFDFVLQGTDPQAQAKYLTRKLIDTQLRNLSSFEYLIIETIAQERNTDLDKDRLRDYAAYRFDQTTHAMEQGIPAHEAGVSYWSKMESLIDAPIDKQIAAAKAKNISLEFLKYRVIHMIKQAQQTRGSGPVSTTEIYWSEVLRLIEEK